jgi:hypothetical protein
LILVSPSQIKTYRSCVRKWALEKLAGLRGPETKAQTLGKEVDDNNLQPYLRDGKPIDETTDAGQIAASGLAWLPQPKWWGLEVQKHFTFVSPSKLGFGYQGYLDLWLPHGGQPGFDDELPVVADFKTTSAMKWALTEEQLRVDPQAVIYNVWAILETKSKTLHNSWLYLQTKGARIARPTQITVTTDEVAEQFRGIEADAKEMMAIRAAMPATADSSADVSREYALSLPGNTDACGDYGGCPFQHLCFKLEDLFDVPSDAIVRKKETNVAQIDLFDMLETKAGAPAPAPAGPPTQAQIAAEPALGINPPMPEGTPLAPPVGSTEAKKRGRPAGSKNKAAAADILGVVPAVASDNVAADLGTTCAVNMAAVPPGGDSLSADTFDVAWVKLGAALKNFLNVMGVVK